MIYMVRRIEDKELFGVINSGSMDLFDKLDEFTDPYGFEYSATPFNKHVRTHGHPIMWRRFVFPSRDLVCWNE